MGRITHFPSPTQIETRYSSWEQSLIRSLGARTSWKLQIALATALCGVISWLFQGAFDDQNYFRFDSFYILRTSLPTILTLILLSLLVFHVPEKRRSLFLAASFLTGSLITLQPLVKLLPNMLLQFLTLITLPSLVLLTWLYAKLSQNSDSPKRLTLLYSLFFWGLVLLPLALFSRQVVTLHYTVLWLSKVPFLYLSAVTLVMQWRRIGAYSPSLFLNPAHAFRGALWPEESGPAKNQQEYFETWWNGYLNLVLGFFLYGVALSIHRLTGGFSTIFLSYLEFALTDIAVFNLLTGATRIFGFRIRDATSFVFLSLTPAETWRRGSVYNYRFILRFVFFPILRRLQSPIFATIGAFTFFTISHWGGSLILIMLTSSDLQNSFEYKLALGRLLQTLTYVATVYFSARYWFWSRTQLSSSARLQWLSCLLTHAVYLAFTYLIYAKYLKLYDRFFF
ncbi:MAG: hypothetical protein ACK5Y2_09965 [Bdellovibrionales bacterium]